MSQRNWICLMALLMVVTVGVPSSVLAQPLSIELQQYVTGLRTPVAGAHPGDGSGRLFILEQIGVIRVIENGTLLPQPFLDVRSRMITVNSGYDERGLLGIAFHPLYEENGRFFIYYSAPGGGGNHQSIVAEYVVSATDPNAADPASERVLMRIPEPEANHNGGMLTFGPAGMLYIGLGDGGGGGDQHGSIGNGQNLETLLGKILRIDVDGEEPYAVPPDNPFVGTEGLDEIWAYGFRNPWKFSFDRVDCRLFVGDVGQNNWEEVDIVERGGNYGWRVMEGTHCFNPRNNCDTTGKILPIAEYSHTQGISITGGYVYRGNRLSLLYGRYVFADYQGRLFYLEEDAQGAWTLNTFNLAGSSNSSISRSINSFVEDEDGSLYVLTTTGGPTSSNGIVYRLQPTNEPDLGVDHFPALLKIYLSGDANDEEIQRGDVNGDSRITPGDIQELFRME